MKDTRQCKQCGEEKPVKLFHKAGIYNGKMYYRGICSDCRNINSRYLYETNEEHKEYMKQNAKRRLENKKEEILEYQKEYYKKNTEHIMTRVKKYEKTEKGKLISRIVAHRRRVRVKKTDDGSIHSKAIETMLEEQEYKCAQTGKDLVIDGKSLFHIDHIIPLCKGGKHTIDNIQLTTPEYNLKKGGKFDSEIDLNLIN